MAIDQKYTRKNVYRDFDINFTHSPFSRDLGVKPDVSAINQSINNLVNTYYYERLFQPIVGCNIRALLFEPVDSITRDNLRQAINETLTNYEPRIRVDQILVEDMPDRNAYRIKIQYTILDVNDVAEFDVVLKRLR